MNLTESMVEEAALGWHGELGYAVGHGRRFPPGEPLAEQEPERSGDSRRQSFGEVVLVGRLREVIRRLNPAIPGEAPKNVLSREQSVAEDEVIHHPERQTA